MRRHRARAAGEPFTDYATLTYRGARRVRRALFQRPAGGKYPDRYGPGLTYAILRGAHALVTHTGDAQPLQTLHKAARRYRPPESPFDFLSRVVGHLIGEPIELARPRRRRLRATMKP